MPGIKSGRVRPLAVTSTKRIESLPDVRPLTEAGYPALVRRVMAGDFSCRPARRVKSSTGSSR